MMNVQRKAGFLETARELFNVHVLEKLRGEDYWIPSDPNELAEIPKHQRSTSKKIEDLVTIRKSPSSGKVVVEVGKYEWSMFRSQNEQEAVDVYQSCLHCESLFDLIVNQKDLKRLMDKIRDHPLWHAVHIAARLGMIKYFDQFTLNDPQLIKLFNTASQPEGQYPLHIAVSKNYTEMVRQMIKQGASIAKTDSDGSNALHYCAKTSTTVLEAVLEFPEAKEVLNAINKEGCTPLFVAVRAGNPMCIHTLMKFGAELNIRCKGRSPLFETMQLSDSGKARKVIGTMLELSPDVFSETEATTGNSALHAAAGKEALSALLMKASDLVDINGKNKAGQTPIHLHTHRGDIGAVMSLISYGADLDPVDGDGNTPLHIAVSGGNTDIVKALLVMRANPNVANFSGNSPRHLAAKLKSGITEEIVLCLSLCGASRCPPGKIGCQHGCAERKTLGLPHSELSIHMELTKLTAMSPEAEEKIEDIRDFKQNMCANRIKKWAAEVERNPGKALGEKPVVNLLSLDGGGIRGLVIIQILMVIEEMMGKDFFKNFNWVAGTSTGSFVAAALAEGKSLKECLHIYLRFKDQLFEGWARPYNTTVLEDYLKQEFGADTMLSDIENIRLMVTTVKADKHPIKLELRRNYRLPLGDQENELLGYGNPAESSLWKALRCSSAAPTYFSSVDGMYIDGGIMANNPTLDLMCEVEFWNTSLEYNETQEENKKKGKKYSPVQIGTVVSIGTGKIPDMAVESLDFDVTSNLYNSVTAMKNLGLIFVDQVCATEGSPVERARTWCHSLKIPFFRFSTPLSKDIPLDTKDDKELVSMMWDTLEYMRANQDDVNQLVDVLRALSTIQSATVQI